MPKLYCKRIEFYSEGDELHFDSWIDKISCVHEREGTGDCTVLHIKRKIISDKCLRELLALFFRYKIDMSQLKQFCTEDNSSWFNSPGKYWYHEVFEK